jgi:hypothetical protein
VRLRVTTDRSCDSPFLGRYCFRDERDREVWRAHEDDLSPDEVITRLVDDLRRRGRIEGAVGRDGALGHLLIDEYVRFPVASP